LKWCSVLLAHMDSQFNPNVGCGKDLLLAVPESAHEQRRRAQDPNERNAYRGRHDSAAGGSPGTRVVTWSDHASGIEEWVSTESSLEVARYMLWYIASKRHSELSDLREPQSRLLLGSRVRARRIHALSLSRCTLPLPPQHERPQDLSVMRRALARGALCVGG
jgi:hypothetical protein